MVCKAEDSLRRNLKELRVIWLFSHPEPPLSSQVRKTSVTGQDLECNTKGVVAPHFLVKSGEKELSGGLKLCLQSREALRLGGSGRCGESWSRQKRQQQERVRERSAGPRCGKLGTYELLGADES